MQSTPRLVPTPPAAPGVRETEDLTRLEERPRRRFLALVGIFALLGAVILAQLVRYQVFPPDLGDDAPVAQAEPSPRGLIVDRHGTPLVVNRHYYRVTATPIHLDTPQKRDEVARQLQETIHLPYEQTMAVLEDYADTWYAVLADAISLEDAARLADLKAQLAEEVGVFPLQHVQTVAMTTRSYPQGPLTSHLLGFVQLDRGGITGVEEYYDEFLVRDGAGLLGNQPVSVDHLPVDVRRFVPSDVGKDLVLTLDRTVQWIIHEELQRGLSQYGAVAGTIIVMDPHTGAILGLVNLPDYDPNRYELEEISRFPNPAVSAQYEPGSIFKIITMAAALDSAVITPTTMFTDTGSFTIGERVIFNSTRTARGRVSATETLALSLNVITAQIAEQMGPDQFYRYVRLFGFAEATSVDLSGEIAGMIKTPASDLWSLADLGTNSFGQGLAVSPLQMANATTVIANGGRLMRPYVVQARIAGEHMLQTDPVIIRQVLEPETAAAMREMMVEVVESPGSTARIPGYRVAGKSGTAQIPTPDGYDPTETIVSYVGFAPADNPRFVVLVKMDRPDSRTNQWASQTAAPVFARVAQRLLAHLGIPPEAEAVAANAGAGE